MDHGPIDLQSIALPLSYTPVHDKLHRIIQLCVRRGVHCSSYFAHFLINDEMTFITRVNKNVHACTSVYKEFCLQVNIDFY